MLRAAPGDHRGDPGRPDLLAVLAVVIPTAGVDLTRPPAGPSAAATYRRDGPDQGHELGDVVTVAASQTDRQPDAVRLSDHVEPGRARPTGLGPVSGCSPSLTGTLNQRLITAIPRSFC
jgi:hypothetical protein